MYFFLRNVAKRKKRGQCTLQVNRQEKEKKMTSFRLCRVASVSFDWLGFDKFMQGLIVGLWVRQRRSADASKRSVMKRNEGSAGNINPLIKSASACKGC